MNLYQGKPAQKVQKSIIYFFKKIKKNKKESTTGIKNGFQTANYKHIS
jgi:hypothetical protein